MFNIDQAIGLTLRELRTERSLSARQLAVESGVSAAMISRIENAQVSPSIKTLSALSQVFNVPLAYLFKETTAEYADYTLVKKGRGPVAKRISNTHVHEFVNLADHSRGDLHFKAHLVTLKKQKATPPDYIGQGVIFIYILEGKASYRYGEEVIMLSNGDTLSIDAELRHGFIEVLTDELIFLNIQAQRH